MCATHTHIRVCCDGDTSIVACEVMCVMHTCIEPVSIALVSRATQGASLCHGRSGRVWRVWCLPLGICVCLQPLAQVLSTEVCVASDEPHPGTLNE